MKKLLQTTLKGMHAGMVITILLLAHKTARAQDSVQIIKDAVMPCFIGDWDKYNILSIKLVNMQTKKRVVTGHLYISSTNIINTDSSLAPKIAPNISQYTVSLNQFFSNAISDVVPGTMSDDFYDAGRLPAGTYTFKVYTRDTLTLVPIDSFSTQFDVDPYQSAGPTAPFNNAKIYSNILGNIDFVWKSVYPTYSGGTVNYSLVFKEMLAGQTEEQAWATNPAIITYSNTTSPRRIGGGDLWKFPQGKTFLWRVLTKKSGPNTPVGNNKGQSEIFRLYVTNVSTDDNATVRQGMSGWCRFNDFELNNFEGFNFYQSSYLMDNVLETSYTPVKFATTTNVNDNIVGNGFKKLCSNGGTHSGKVGDSLGTIGSIFNADRFRYAYPVDSNNGLLYFNYAIVMEDGGHAANIQPFATYRLYRGKLYSDWDAVDYFRRVVSNKDPFFSQTVTSGVYYRDWACRSYDLSPRYGQSMIMEATVSDCSPGAHFGYAYFDFCTDNTPSANINMPSSFCINDSVWFDADSSLKETMYKVNLMACDSLGHIDTTKTATQLYVGKQVGHYNLSALINDTMANIDNIKWECGQYYKLILAVGNECTPWALDSNVFSITCPAKALAGPDRCCDPPPIYLGDSSRSGYTYSWSPTTFLQSPSSYVTLCIPTGAVVYPLTYYLTVNAGSCQSTDTVRVFCDPIACSIIFDTSGCANKIFFDCANTTYSQITWNISDITISNSLKQTKTFVGDTLRYNPVDGHYAKVKYTISNPCGSIVDSFALGNKGYVSGDTLICGNAIGTNVDSLVIYEKHKNIGDSFTFGHATEWRIMVLGGWGSVFSWIAGKRQPDLYAAHGYGDPVYGIRNGDIYWKGTYYSGGDERPLWQGVYYIKLQVKKCGHDWEDIEYANDPQNGCLKWKWSWAKFKRVCSGGYGPIKNPWIEVTILR